MNYGPVWVDIDGTKLLEEEIPILQHPQTGGVLLFANNFTDISQLCALTQAIREYAGKPILISVDHEGGEKWRFYQGFHKPFAPIDYGNLYQKDPQLALRNLEEAGKIVAHELLKCGVDLSFAPVLDIDDGTSLVIGNRSYSKDPIIATECARAFIKGLKAQGMTSVGKHFPGHGGCVMDSHFTAAIDERNLTEIEAKDLIPFSKLSEELGGIMPAHVVYSAVDPLPAGFSSFWLQTILRQKLGFNGAIVSDCLSMKGSGYSENVLEGIHLALSAGCDMVIVSKQSRKGLLNILNAMQWEVDAAQNARIAGLAGNFVNSALKYEPEFIEMLTYS